MKKILSAVILCAALAAGLGQLSSVCAAETMSDKGFVNISTSSEEEYAPNVAQIKFYVETNGKDMNKITEENKKTAAKAIDAIKKILDPAKGETIKTAAFNVDSEYSYKNNVRTFVRYNVTNSFEVTIKDVSKLGKLIAAGLDNGANKVDSLRFSLDNTETQCNALITKSVKMAQSRAKATASAFGGVVTGVKQINASCTSGNIYFSQYRMMNSAKAMGATEAVSADSVAVPTEMGTIKLRANVDAQFWVK